MNLEKLNLVELNAQEVKETEGGGWTLIGRVVGAVGAFVITQYDSLKEGFQQGYNGKPLKYEKCKC